MRMNKAAHAERMRERRLEQRERTSRIDPVKVYAQGRPHKRIDRIDFNNANLYEPAAALRAAEKDQKHLVVRMQAEFRQKMVDKARAARAARYHGMTGQSLQEAA